MSGRVLNRISALSAALAVAFAVPAHAQDPTQAGYGGPQTEVGEVLGNFNAGGQDDVIPPPTNPTAPDGEQAPTPRVTTPTERGVDAPVPTASISQGELPFTGLDAGLVALAGIALLAGGFAMRRASRAS